MEERFILDTKKLKRFIITMVAIFLGLFLLFKSIYYLAPFIAALVIAILIEPLVNFFINKIRLKRHLASAVALLLVLAVAGSLLTAIVFRIVREVSSLSAALPDFIEDTYNNLNSIDTSSFLSRWVPEGVTYDLSKITSQLLSSLSGIANSLAKGIFNTASVVPNFFLFLLAMIMGTYFLSSSKNQIFGLMEKHLPPSWLGKFKEGKNGVFRSVGKFLKAYMIILSITFIELLVGFNVLGVKYATVLALVISIFDILPALGTGGVLLPWALYSFLTGSKNLGIGLLVVYGVVLVIRQVIEPKIVGGQIGVHPLFTLMGMYIGYKGLGASGLILGPITILILKGVLTSVYKDRTLKDILFNRDGFSYTTKKNQDL